MESNISTSMMYQLCFTAANAAISSGLAYLGVKLSKRKQLDPNCESSEKALQCKKQIAERFGRPLVDTNPYEDLIICDVINPDHVQVMFEDIGGLANVKQELINLVILPLQRPELFSNGKLLGPQKGILLHGPPGTGKTMLAKAIAKESGAVFINVMLSTLMSKYLGDAQKHVAAVFSLAHKLQPAIIFIDEVDGFLGQRRSSDNEFLTTMKTEFMSLWDGFTTDEHSRVMVLGATNRPSELDEAIRRRFCQSFEIGKPDRKEREAILKIILIGENVEDNIDFYYLAGLCEECTGSDLLQICKKAANLPINELLDAEKSGNPFPAPRSPRPLAQSDLEKVLRGPKNTETAAHEYSKLSWQLVASADTENQATLSLCKALVPQYQPSTSSS